MRPNAESFGYDHDGNLTSDGNWTYQYNAADQLVLAVSQFADGTGKRVAIKYIYDYLGRRAAKYVYDATTSGTPDEAACRYKRMFVYEGWSLIAEYEKAGNAAAYGLTRTFTWGPDLTGGGGAGGIGGLLAIRDYRTMYEGIYNPGFDGNGNVTALIHAGTGDIAAAYEYDAYGNAVRSSGAYARENPVRFSTKYHDTETGLAYYGYRYYSPSMGRFINRDPLREEGGLNIYAMTANNPVCAWDYLGLDTPLLMGGDISLGGYVDFMSGIDTSWLYSSGNYTIPEMFADYDYTFDLFAGINTSITDGYSFGSYGYYGSAMDYGGNSYGNWTLGGSSLDMRSSLFTGNYSFSAPNNALDTNNNPLNTQTARITSGSKLGNALRRIPLLGGILGGVGDVLSGVGNIGLATATLGRVFKMLNKSNPVWQR